MPDLPRPPKKPCGTCPYRKDVPSGVWEAHEYEKLPSYDGDTWQQSPAVFLCHQKDGCLCGGWLTTHDPQHLLALRINPVDDSAFSYQHNIPCFASGAEAAAHGLRDIPHPSPEAQRKIDGLVRKREKETR